jgi:hypothetical protein
MTTELAEQPPLRFISGAHRVASVQPLKSFVDAVRPVLSAEDPETFWECEQPFRQLLGSGFLTEVINYELGKILADVRYCPDKAAEYEMLICESETFWLNVKVIPPGFIHSKYVYSHTGHSMLGVWGDAATTVHLYEQPVPHPVEVFDRSRLLIDKGQVELRPGQISLFRAGYDMFRMVPANELVIFVILSTVPLLRMRWCYDPHTLAPVRSEISDLMTSRIEFACSALGQMADPSSIPAMKMVLDHPAHFIRWAAIKSILLIDHREGIPLLINALEDPHPHVRNAASRTLARFADRIQREYTGALTTTQAQAQA